jgi:hypothetical protein
MGSPQLNLLDALERGDQVGASPAPIPTPERASAKHSSGETPGDDDLQRLQRSLAWLKRERTIAEREAGIRPQHHRRRLPRARGLDPVSGIPPVRTEGAGQKRHSPTFQLAPPLPSERIQAPVARRERAHTIPEALCILIAIVIVGSIAYHISVGKFSAAGPAHAASLHAP